MNRNFKLMFLTAALTGSLLAETVVPEGTPIKLRLSEPLSSGRNVVGQGVALTVSEDVMVGETVVIEAGSRATGMVTMAQKKGMMGHSGKLDFTPEKVQLVDGRMVPVRTMQQSFQGKGKGITSGVITAGLAIAFWPAAPFALMMKGKDVDVPAGVVFTSFTDAKFTLNGAAPVAAAAKPAVPPVEASATATVAMNSDVDGADVEIDGKFVGQTPSAFKVSAGTHRLVVRSGSASWERTLDVNSGTSLSLRAVLNGAELKAAAVAR